jgi:hypothetical protein
MAMGTKKNLRECQRIADEHGVTWESNRHNAKHIGADLRFGEHRRHFTIAVSGSSNQLKLFRSDLRKWLRDVGVQI